ncbi:hypothetical protein AUJ68_00325 [Candidatus Woesearchaeota archaeon CG1_02_57_44]|nr:MAG: hypothetical protein AUJ68_00325 [Candidatus Woesearchaeota archaeon CG1_02_57_44]PIN70844.1 MAG: hypothetical protein COV94_01030 [Candidatus Woesearchaeota archaeon CG11_big_fil_rev_8_21_14_0_20_57_5]
MRKKIYGQSRIDKCPLCGKQAIARNSQGLPVCSHHKNATVTLKCICGERLDILEGKYGTFCNCFNCGNVSLAKALSMN